ncbi:MAG: methionyl-tRNA formyltransferase [Betaproteobacteria bacterium]|nr:methionyl-tRNA formyltransferase [Betaproteobacteria bacterium]
MQLAFAGTPPFAERALAALHAAGHGVVLVLTQPDRPLGRGLQATPSAVKRWALANGLRVEQPATLAAGGADLVRGSGAEVMVVAAYGLLLPREVLVATSRGALNVHASLLPRWRGAAPIHRAILAGDSETGISIMQMDAGLDTGPVLLQRAMKISPHDDAGTLHERLSALGAALIVEALERLPHGSLSPLPQEEAHATYAKKIAKSETRLRWDRPAVELERAIRAFRPTPGAWVELQGKRVKLWRARVAKSNGTPGRIIDSNENLMVACGKDALVIDEVQIEGGRPMTAAEFIRGHRLRPGESIE